MTFLVGYWRRTNVLEQIDSVGNFDLLAGSFHVLNLPELQICDFSDRRLLIRFRANELKLEHLSDRKGGALSKNRPEKSALWLEEFLLKKLLLENL